MEMGGAFLFLRKDFSQSQTICETANVLHNTGLYTIILLNCTLAAVTMIISFILVVVKLQKKTITFNSEMQNARYNYSKVNKSLLITLVVYISLIIPVIVSFCIKIFVDIGEMLTLVNVLMLLFFMNNAINPFIYYLTLKEFKQGYKNLLFCKCINKQNNQEIELEVVER